VSFEEDIARVFADIEGAWNAGDAAAYARVFASDAIYVTRSGLVWQGRPEIEEGHAKAFGGSLANSTIELRPSHVAFPEPTVAVAQVEIELTVVPAVTRAITTFVLWYDGDEWLVVAAHTGEIASLQ
jgi:uncharacterized protein (TIGR02246 family)